ncbi:hypothetical protein HOU08_gp107 [Dickeya phage vB_DsoM_JA29]|uniref:KTSC and Metallopeptidase-like N-terminal fusion domain-containing protein n=1 Tax=Dickeya phage vB_DsoM_JA29 TaxID=2283031 RepID=A0A384ZX40_9CAUD|nr:hypothetical protein HOU08_gp107 [Dickeya phage vB_DsoM_JA29]AXG66833.1 hypothetical protein JA29_107 [Dickeya phage vB_DsoM_JA29]
MIVQKPSRVISDLGIIPRSISKVGDHFIGHNGRAAYVWHRGEITEIVPGDRIAHESISADAVERLTGMHFAGTRDDNQTVFMSASSSVHVQLVPPKEKSISYNLATAMLAAREYAENSQRVFDVLDVSSESAAPKYLKYTGKKMAVDDASDEYDLELEKGDLIKITYLNKDRYDLRLKDSPRIQFIVRGHETAQNIMGALEFTAPFGQISDLKNDSFAYVGTAKKKLLSPLIPKGTVVLLRRKKHYLAHNLAVPIESWMDSQAVKTLLSNLTVDPEGTSYIKGKAIRSTPKVAPVGQAEKLPKLENATKVTGTGSPRNIKTVYGAFFPVSPSTPNRSRVIFADTQAKLQTQVRDIIGGYTSPVDYRLFTSLTTDENYKKAIKNKVVIKTTPILENTYKVSQTVKMAAPVQLPTFVEPKADAPKIEFPIYDGTVAKTYDFLRRLIEEGYFSTGVRLAHPQPTTGIRFSAPEMNDVVYDQVLGIARRITSYLMYQGVPLKKGAVRLARGKKAAELRLTLPPATKEQQESFAKFYEDYPTLNAPIYETIRPKQPTVEITEVHLHTGKVTARAQRGPALYGAPFEVYYSQVKRKIF